MIVAQISTSNTYGESHYCRLHNSNCQGSNKDVKLVSPLKALDGIMVNEFKLKSLNINHVMSESVQSHLYSYKVDKFGSSTNELLAIVLILLEFTLLEIEVFMNELNRW